MQFYAIAFPISVNIGLHVLVPPNQILQLLWGIADDASHTLIKYIITITMTVRMEFNNTTSVEQDNPPWTPTVKCWYSISPGKEPHCTKQACHVSLQYGEHCHKYIVGIVEK